MSALPPIYWINLDRSLERRTRMVARLATHGLEGTRIAAVDGRAPAAQVAIVASPGTSLLEAARIASHLSAMERAYADGVPWALVLEDDTTFELEGAWVDGFGTIERSLPTHFGVAHLSLGGPPRQLDRIFRERDLVLPLARFEACSVGAYVVERDAMRVLLDRFATSGRYDVSSAPGCLDTRTMLALARTGPSARGPVLSRIPLFLHEARDSEVDPEGLVAQRTARAFVLAHHHALLRRTYTSPFSWGTSTIERVRAMFMPGADADDAARRCTSSARPPS